MKLERNTVFSIKIVICKNMQYISQNIYKLVTVIHIADRHICKMHERDDTKSLLFFKKIIHYEKSCHPPPPMIHVQD